jgi:hypothetical protein
MRLLSVFLLASSVCWGQSEFPIPLARANSALSLPSMAVRDDVVYTAYRSFDVLRFSNQLQIVAYDLKAHKELQHVTISVPKVHGARASEGLFLSEDGQTLAYAELHEPNLILLLATKNLAEIKRSNALPFTSDDHQRMFAGFDHDQLCIASNFYQFGKPDASGLHFIRLGLADLKPISDTKASGVWQETSGQIVWLPKEQRTWTNPPGKLGSDVWTEYTEAGQKTGQALAHRNGLSNGAVALGDGRLLACYGNMISKGAVVSYADHHEEELELPCAAHQYGRSGDQAYVGGICTTEKDVLPEARGKKILSSQFLLIKSDGPKIAWHHDMDFLGVSNGNEPDAGFQKGDPLIYRSGSKLLIVAPSKAPALTVYEIDAPQ